MLSRLLTIVCLGLVLCEERVHAASAVEYQNGVEAFSNAEYDYVTCDVDEFNCTDGCTRTQGYWSTHHSGSNNPNLAEDWATGNFDENYNNKNYCFDRFHSLVGTNATHSNGAKYYWVDEDEMLYVDPDTQVTAVTDRFFSGVEGTPYDAITKGPGKNGKCYMVAMQTVANYLFGEDCQNDPDGYVVPQDGLDAKDILDGYNNGVTGSGNSSCDLLYGPYHCEDFRTCYNCPAEPDDCPLDTCEGGCTRTQGYWKNHRLNPDQIKGKKKRYSYPGWNDICPVSFLSGQTGMTCVDNVCTPALETIPFAPYVPAHTWAGILDVPSNTGEACVIASKQLIAYELNHNCGGSCTTATVQLAVSVVKEILIEECSDATLVNGVLVDGLDSSTTQPSNSTHAMNRRRLKTWTVSLKSGPKKIWLKSAILPISVIIPIWDGISPSL
jgi:hypothetical protein